MQFVTIFFIFVSFHKLILTINSLFSCLFAKL